MINYARERAIEVLKGARIAVLATDGPSGIQVGEFPCEAVELVLYLLLPCTSDHLFNLEHDDRVVLHTGEWEVSGRGRALSPEDDRSRTTLLPKARSGWYTLVLVEPRKLQVLRTEGWGPAETIDLTSLL